MNRTALLSLLATLLVFAADSHAGVFHDLNDNRYELLGDQFDGQALWVETDGPSGTVFRGTAVRLNEFYGLMTAHQFTQGGPFTNFVVGNGSNYLTDRGETRQIVDFGIHPSWDGTFGNGSADLAWVRFDSPLAGEDLTIGDALLGEDVTFAGYGDPAVAGQPTLSADGERRAFTAEVDDYGFSPFGVDALYASSRFRVPSFSGPLGGKGNGGDSGALGINASGELDLLIAGGSIGNGYGELTFAVRLGLYRDWIEANTAIPEPSSLAIVAALLPALTWRRRSGLRR